jgi:galactokinase
MTYKYMPLDSVWRVIINTQSKLNNASEEPSEAETEVWRAIERLSVAKNTTCMVMINGMILEDFNSMYYQQKTELAELKKKMKESY